MTPSYTVPVTAGSLHLALKINPRSAQFPQTCGSFQCLVSCTSTPNKAFTRSWCSARHCGSRASNTSLFLTNSPCTGRPAQLHADYRLLGEQGANSTFLTQPYKMRTRAVFPLGICLMEAFRKFYYHLSQLQTDSHDLVLLPSQRNPQPRAA